MNDLLQRLILGGPDMRMGFGQPRFLPH